MNMESIVSAKEAARLLGVSVTAVHRLCSRGTLASIWIGSQRFIRKEALAALKSNADYIKRTRAASMRGKSLDDLRAEGQLVLGSDMEGKDGESNAEG